MLRRWRAKLVAGSVILSLSGLLIATVTLPGLRPRDWLLRQYVSELASLPPNRWESQLEQMVVLSDEGLIAVVPVIGDSREAAATAAGNVLRRDLARCRLLPADQSLPRVRLLANELARLTPTFSPHGRQIAADLATQLLSWPTPGDATGNALIEPCESVLRIAASSPTRPAFQASTGGDALRWPAAASYDAFLSQLPGSELPVEIVTPPELPPATPRPPVGDDPSAPRLLTPPPAFELQQQNPLRAETEADPVPNGFSRQDAWERLETIDVMRRLQAADAEIVKAVRTELRRRRFSAAEIEVAMRLTDLRTEVRRRLAEELPRLPVSDARPWLLWLSDDSQSSVRQAAAAVMATSNDPAIRKRLLELGLRPKVD